MPLEECEESYIKWLSNETVVECQLIDNACANLKSFIPPDILEHVGIDEACYYTVFKLLSPLVITRVTQL
jgi:hypothetical protein